MTKFFLPLVLSVGLLLNACTDDKTHTAFIEVQSAPEAASMVPMRSRAIPRRENVVKPGSPTRMLAFRYAFSFAIPARKLEQVSQKVVQDCMVAGLDRCQIVNSSVNEYSPDQVSANILMRVEPKWFEEYRKELVSSSQAAGGKITSTNVSAEDLTLAITDGDAKLQSLLVLRTRLLSLLQTRGSTVKDLISVERELARVQGQIESSTARVRVLKTRVSMSEVRLDYQSKAVIAGQSAFQPILSALTDFVGTVAYGLANLIRFVAVTLPWMVVGVPVLWVLARLWRRRGAGKKKPKS
ncbi:MAG: hypothetical protein COA47_05060 [Robiginitomaculum sp.]|nr:MAG: hypothetical protein COA47_05060 [Robiginitomaculum sp.]